jgi:hypothetical protein
MLMRTSADLAEHGANTRAKPILQKFLSFFSCRFFFDVNKTKLNNPELFD